MGMTIWSGEEEASGFFNQRRCGESREGRARW